jgi:hypothetical protein
MPRSVSSDCAVSWNLPCWETAVHAIPGLGIISSFSSWIYTRKELKRLPPSDGELITTPIFDVYPDGGRYHVLLSQKSNRITICAINTILSLGLGLASLYVWGIKK